MREGHMTVVTPELNEAFALDVFNGLTKSPQKELPSRYLYDETGSRLFEEITLLPEYGLTRADSRLLRNHAGEIAHRMPPNTLVAELGSGNGKKSRKILETFGERQHICYFPIEISRTALEMSRRELADIQTISVVGFEKEYLDGLAEVAARRGPDESILVLFLGSTIGNFEHPTDITFLRDIRRALLPGDALLLGTDLGKPIDQIIAAYDDSLGVTAAFSLNLLVRINRELNADFIPGEFGHLAVFNPLTRSIEMHLRSKRCQLVNIAGAGVSVEFAECETIRTETSHKYSLAEIDVLARSSGFVPEAQWVDTEWPFAETLLRVI